MAFNSKFFIYNEMEKLGNVFYFQSFMFYFEKKIEKLVLFIFVRTMVNVRS